MWALPFFLLLIGGFGLDSRSKSSFGRVTFFCRSHVSLVVPASAGVSEGSDLSTLLTLV